MCSIKTKTEEYTIVSDGNEKEIERLDGFQLPQFSDYPGYKVVIIEHHGTLMK